MDYELESARGGFITPQATTIERAIELFNSRARRRGLPSLEHLPGDVHGDVSEQVDSGHRRIQGVRDGHGIVYLEIRGYGQ